MLNFFYFIRSLLAFLSFYIVNNIYSKKVKSQNRILFIQTGGIGDLIQSTKVINTLDNSTNEITYLIKDKHKEFFQFYSGQIKLFIIDYDRYKTNLLYRIRTLQKLRLLGFVNVFVLNHHRRIMDDDLALNIGAYKIVALNKVGKNFIKIGKSYIDSKYSDILYHTNEFVQIKYDSLIAKYFDISITKDLSIYLDEQKTLSDLTVKISNLVGQAFISINPVSSAEIKNWKIEKFIGVITHLLNNYSYKILLLGEGYQYNYLQKMNINYERILNLAGKTNLLESFLLVKKNVLFIGVDSSLAHSAIFFNIPRLLLLGGGSFGLHFPADYYNKEVSNQKLIFNEMDCFGCNWHCKFEQPHCLNDVSVNTVNEIIDSMLSPRVE